MSDRKQTRFINRPNKEYVREEILRLIAAHTNASANPDRWCYVSLAGYRFIDLVEVYRRFRIRSLFSLEEDPSLHQRATFNQPYAWVTVVQGRLPEFIPKYDAALAGKSKIVFLDYTGSLADDIVEELDELFLSSFFGAGGLLFLTLNAQHGSPSPYVRQQAKQRFLRKQDYLDWLKLHIPDLIRTKLRARYKDKDVRELAKLSYQDTSPMCVFGFKIGRIKDLLEPYQTLEFEEIEVPDLTPIEEHLLRRQSSKGAAALSEITGVLPTDIEFFLKHE